MLISEKVRGAVSDDLVYTPWNRTYGLILTSIRRFQLLGKKASQFDWAWITRPFLNAGLKSTTV